MYQAIAAGEAGRYTAPPNPWVGAVVVKEGVVLGVGYHAKAGQPHAEPNAFADAVAKVVSPLEGGGCGTVGACAWAALSTGSANPAAQSCARVGELSWNMGNCSFCETYF